MIEPPRPQSKVSLEDLLRLKRAERPAAEFWADFEAQLRRKQLAAIVDKRPWWRRLSTASLARISIPVGATAVIAFTLVTVYERTQPMFDTATVAATVGEQALVSNPTATASEHSSPKAANPTLLVASDNSATPVSLPVSTVGAAASTSVTNDIMAVSVAMTSESSEPSLAQVILGLEGTNETDAQPRYQSEVMPLLTSLDVLDADRASGISAIDASPLTQISAPRDERRARLLASVDSQERGDLVAGNSRVARSRERIANRLTEQSLYDSIRRLGLNGDSVSIKF